MLIVENSIWIIRNENSIARVKSHFFEVFQRENKRQDKTNGRGNNKENKEVSTVLAKKIKVWFSSRRTIVSMKSIELWDLVFIKFSFINRPESIMYLRRPQTVETKWGRWAREKIRRKRFVFFRNRNKFIRETESIRVYRTEFAARSEFPFSILFPSIHKCPFRANFHREIRILNYIKIIIAFVYYVIR